MQREGYGGAILMDANGSDQGGNALVTPGPTFGSPGWQALLLHTLKEAKRLSPKVFNFEQTRAAQAAFSQFTFENRNSSIVWGSWKVKNGNSG
jgi:hypothetical protein